MRIESHDTCGHLNSAEKEFSPLVFVLNYYNFKCLCTFLYLCICDNLQYVQTCVNPYAQQHISLFLCVCLCGCLFARVLISKPCLWCVKREHTLATCTQWLISIMWETEIWEKELSTSYFSPNLRFAFNSVGCSKFTVFLISGGSYTEFLSKATHVLPLPSVYDPGLVSSSNKEPGLSSGEILAQINYCVYTCFCLCVLLLLDVVTADQIVFGSIT